MRASSCSSFWVSRQSSLNPIDPACADPGAQELPPARATVPPSLRESSSRASTLPACSALGPPVSAAQYSCRREPCTGRSAWLPLGIRWLLPLRRRAWPRGCTLKDQASGFPRPWRADAQCEGRWASWVAGPLARSVCPVASNPVGDLVHAGFELL